MPTQPTIKQLAHTLALLRSSDQFFEIFGAQTHKYSALSPVSDHEVSHFESEFGIELPTDYREWITRVARGGAGPFHGLIPFADPKQLQFWNEWGHAQLTTPNALQQTWSYPQADITPDNSPYNGCILLAERDHGHTEFLVVHGTNKGTVWSDCTTTQGPIQQSAPSFLEWLAQWLEVSLYQWAANALPHIVSYGNIKPHAGIDAALPTFATVVKENPDDPHAHRALGYACIYRGLWSAAQESFDKMRDRFGDDEEPEARHLLGMADLYAAQGETLLQETTLLRALNCNDIWTATRQKAHGDLKRLYFQTQRADEAFALMEDFAKDHPTDLNAQQEFAWALYLQSDVTQAQEVLSKAVDVGLGSNANATREQRIAIVFGPLINGLQQSGDTAAAEDFERMSHRVLGN